VFVLDQLGRCDTGADDSIGVVEPPTTSWTARTSDGDATRLRGRPETGLTHISTVADDSDGLGETLPGVETRFLEGESEDQLAVTGPAIMDGYVARPTLTADRVTTVAETRWIRTGITANELRKKQGVSCVDDPMESVHDRSHPISQPNTPSSGK